MLLRYQIVTAGLAAAVMAAGLALAPGPAAAGETGVLVPPGGTYTFGTHKGAHGAWQGHRSGTHKPGHKSGPRVFGKTGHGGKFVRPKGEEFGHGGKPFVHKDGGKLHKDGGKHRKHAHRKLRGHRFPVIVYPLGGSYAVTTGPDQDIYEDAARAEETYEDADADDDVFAITNRTDQTMTVYDNGRRVCVLAPGVRCSFDVSTGRHDVSIGLGDSGARRAVPRASGAGKMIVVWEALEKRE